MPDPLLSPTFLFRFSAPCRMRDATWTPQSALLGDEYLLPRFGALDGQRQFAELRSAWNPRGLAFDLRVVGKQQAVCCRQSRMEDSDGLQIWIDTRDAHNIHRATRFCHRFVCLPQGSGSRTDQPAAALIPINRARANPQPVDPAQLTARSQVSRGGYRLQLFLPAGTLTGYDPQEQPRLGFFYAVIDRELGWQTLSVGPEFPFQEDPSLWGTLELI